MTLEQIKDKVGSINEVLTALGLLPIDIVNPADCLPQQKNARYFKPEIFKQLVSEIRCVNHLFCHK